MVFSIGAFAEELKWGVSLGYENIDYGLTLENIDAGTSSSGIISGNTVVEGSMSYGALAFSVDMKYGIHSFSVKSATGDSEDLMPANDFPYSGWSHTDSNDRTETSLNYTYKINNNWSIAVGTYNGLNEQNFSNTKTFPGPSLNGLVVADWDTSEIGLQEADSIGEYVAAVYQDQINNTLFWYAKLGYQEASFEFTQKYKYAEQAVANQNWFDLGGTQDSLAALFTGGGGTAFYDWDIDYAVESEGSAVVLGLGLVYVLTPKDTITLGYERKNFSYDAGDVTKYDYTGIAEGTSSGSVDSPTTGVTFDEDAEYLTLTYRHQF